MKVAIGETGDRAHIVTDVPVVSGDEDKCLSSDDDLCVPTINDRLRLDLFFVNVALLYVIPLLQCCFCSVCIQNSITNVACTDSAEQRSLQFILYYYRMNNLLIIS